MPFARVLSDVHAPYSGEEPAPKFPHRRGPGSRLPPPPRQPRTAVGNAIPTADEAVFLLRINRELQVCLIPTALNKWHFNTAMTAS